MQINVFKLKQRIAIFYWAGTALTFAILLHSWMPSA